MPTNDEVKEMGRSINEMTKPQVEFIVKKCQQRYETIAQEKTLEMLEQVRVNDRVEITQIKPKYLSGMRGTVLEVNPSSDRPFIVEIDSRYNTRRYSKIQKLRGNMIRKVG